MSGSHRGDLRRLHVAVDSPVHRLDPAAELVGTVAFAVVVAGTPRHAVAVFALEAVPKRVTLTPSRGESRSASVTRTVTLNVPAGVDDGQNFKTIPGEGEPGRNGGPAGDLYITCTVRHGSELFPGLGPHSRCLSMLPWAHVYAQTGEPILAMFVQSGGGDCAVS